MRRAWILAVLLLGTACARAGSGGASGIEGRVLLGPQCPVVTETSRCSDKPVAGKVLVLTPQGDEVATVESGSDGRFRIELPPGSYVLQAQVPAGAMFAKPVDVTVAPGEFVRVNVLLDTGIRGPERQTPVSP